MYGIKSLNRLEFQYFAIQNFFKKIIHLIIPRIWNTFDAKTNYNV